MSLRPRATRMTASKTWPPVTAKGFEVSRLPQFRDLVPDRLVAMKRMRFIIPTPGRDRRASSPARSVQPMRRVQRPPARCAGFSLVIRLASVLLATVAGVSPSTAQIPSDHPPSAGPCDDAAHHQFDFWLGEWLV